MVIILKFIIRLKWTAQKTKIDKQIGVSWYLFRCSTNARYNLKNLLNFF